MNIFYNYLIHITSKCYAFGAEDFSAVKPSTSGTTTTGQLFYGLERSQYVNTLDGILNLILVIGGALAFLALIIGAIQYLLAAGDPQKAGTAKKTITYAIIGVVLATLLLLIINFVAEGLFQ